MVGPNQNAHMALVRSLSSGTPHVDRYRNETSDVSYTNGHYYTAKAPGLALVTEPYYVALKAGGLAVADHVAEQPFPQAMLAVPRTAVWQLALFGAALPALLALILVRAVGERLVPGYGTVAAVALGAGSLLAFFATLFFDHALSACLGFAAFAVLVRERQSEPNLGLVAAAGGLAGLAVTAEFPLGIVAAVLAAYVCARGERFRRLGAYAAGVVAGVVPLLAFDTWAFGSPTALSYVNAVSLAGVSGHDVLLGNAPGFFGVELPSLRVAIELLVSSKGLVVLAPVWALAGLGVVILWRRSFRAEAAVIGVVACAFVAYNCAYLDPFGGFPGGTRFLVPTLPFLAVAVAAAWRAEPLLTASLALASIVVTSVGQVADPGFHSEDAGTWFHRLQRGQVTETVLGHLGGSNVLGVAMMLTVVAAAVALALAVTERPRLERRDLTLAAAGLVLWRVVYVGAPIVIEGSASRALAGSAVVITLAAAVVSALVLVARSNRLGLVAVLMLLPLAWPAFAAHLPLAGAASGCALATAVTAALGEHRRSPRLLVQTLLRGPLPVGGPRRSHRPS
jgi:hypothetical protein